MNERDSVELSRCEGMIDFLVIDVFSPFHLQGLSLFSAAPCDVEPFVGECAAHAAKHAFVYNIADSGFHHTPGRRSGQEDGLFCSEKFLQVWVNVAIEIFEGFAAMPDHRAGKGGERFFRNFDWTGDEKLVV